MDTVYAPSGATEEQRVETYYPRPAWTRVVVCAGTENASMDTVYAPAGRTVEQRVESYYPRTGVDEGGSVRRHTE